MPSIMQLEEGEVPAEGHPDREQYLIMQRDARSLLGLEVWWFKKYTKIQFAVTRCGQFAHNPSWGVWRAITFILMHLYDLFVERDAEVVEINPMLITTDNKLVVNHAKILIDRDSEYR